MSIINIFESNYPRDLANIIFSYVKNEIKLKSFFDSRNKTNNFFFGDDITFDEEHNIRVTIRLKPYYTVDVLHYTYHLHDDRSYIDQKHFDDLHKLIEFFINAKYTCISKYTDIPQKKLDIQVINMLLDKIYKMKLIWSTSC